MATLQQFKDDRQKKLDHIREVGWDPYPSSFDKKQSVEECVQLMGKTVKTAGRLFSFRSHGNIAFADLRDETGKIQLFFKKDVLGSEAYKNLSLIDIGDFLGVEGEVVKTVAGEISIIPSAYTLLSKSLLPLPHQWFGLKDTEERFRQRYLDLLLNEDVRKRFNTRTKVLRYTREYLDSLNFWEVETPILQELYGGANAKPFTTHYHALGQDKYLRIAFELYLKRLIVGGYERVYEIGKDFRNEGIDRSHSPEFTMIEWYEAYADYQRMMDVTEGLFKHLAQKINGSLTMNVDDRTISLDGAWPRVTMTSILKQTHGVDVEQATDQELCAICKSKGIELMGGETKGQLIYVLFEHTIPQTLINPTWIIDYPEDVSPLAKGHRTKAGWVERFEGYIAGKEICDGWSELTDPSIQRKRFTNDMNVARKDKAEAQQIDEDFLTAMEYGMPPTGGIGIGIDRLTMFFANIWSIRETILFPTLKSSHKQEIVNRNPVTQEAAQPGITREKAYELLTTHISNKNLIKHNLAVEAAMRGLAEHFGESPEMWGLLGLVHDLDWEITKDTPEDHAKKTVEILNEVGPLNPEVGTAIRSHTYGHNDAPEPSSRMAWALYCTDDLTGLIVATALVTPTKKLQDVTVDSVVKKMRSKSFAAQVNREQIQLCEEKLGLGLEDHVSLVLRSMQSIAPDLGL